ncbi:hypothetical protein CSC2_04410 [Clostridium zeae]|uniref:Uncharacterized protein n=1 Tax=Clostridium zeae TaxID=2759022 RepID=A0ABQ1E591_9CLOT|nr:hypothetical protein CSC2_04410 [Clostridium zeae]
MNDKLSSSMKLVYYNFLFIKEHIWYLKDKTKPIYYKCRDYLNLI